MTDDTILLRQFTRNRSQTAFTSIVERHVDLVYGAKRKTGSVLKTDHPVYPRNSTTTPHWLDIPLGRYAIVAACPIPRTANRQLRQVILAKSTGASIEQPKRHPTPPWHAALSSAKEGGSKATQILT